METDPRHPAFASEIEAVEARAWASLSAVTASELLFDTRGMVAGVALFSSAEHPLANRVIGLGLERPVQPQMLDKILEMYDAKKNGPVFIPAAPTARPSSLPRLLQARGFEPSMKEAKLYRKTENPPAKDPRDRVFEAKEADHEIALSLYRGSGMHSDWADVMAGNLGSRNWHHFIALEGDRPVALASFFASQGHALCFPGWTLPGYRHRGYQRALLAHRIAAAAELGCSWVSVNVDLTDSPIGFTTRSYTRVGFELLYVRTTHIRLQPNVAAPNAFSRRLLIPHS